MKEGGREGRGERGIGGRERRRGKEREGGEGESERVGERD